METKTERNNLNVKALILWLGTGHQKMAALADGAGLSINTIMQMKIGNYRSKPKPFTRKLMCNVTGIPEEQLFPFVAEENRRTS